MWSVESSVRNIGTLLLRIRLMILSQGALRNEIGDYLNRSCWAFQPGCDQQVGASKRLMIRVITLQPSGLPLRG